MRFVYSFAAVEKQINNTLIHIVGVLNALIYLATTYQSIKETHVAMKATEPLPLSFTMDTLF